MLGYIYQSDQCYGSQVSLKLVGWGTPTPITTVYFQKPRSDDMVKGYLSELDRYTKLITDCIEPLEFQIADGEKSEGRLKPLIDALSKSIEDYQKGVKTIKSAYESRT